MDGITVLPLEILPFDVDLAVASGRLRPVTVHAGLSLGDRACLALGRTLGRRVLTADAQWLGLVPDVNVEMIR